MIYTDTAIRAYWNSFIDMYGLDKYGYNILTDTINGEEFTCLSTDVLTVDGPVKARAWFSCNEKPGVAEIIEDPYFIPHINITVEAAKRLFVITSSNNETIRGINKIFLDGSTPIDKLEKIAETLKNVYYTIIK